MTAAKCPTVTLELLPDVGTKDGSSIDGHAPLRRRGPAG